MANINRWRVPASLALIVSVVLATEGFQCGGGGGGGGGTPATTGMISVSTGFGAVTSNPYQCTGSGNITVTPQSLNGSTGTATAQPKPFGYSGFSSTTTPPACQQTVIFPDMRTGTWQVTNGGATCPATVTAGQTATVRIWNNVCQ